MYVVELPTKNWFLYLYSLSLVREASLYSGQHLTQTLMTGQNVESDSNMIDLK